jgi:hypothetical protein
MEVTMETNQTVISRIEQSNSKTLAKALRVRGVNPSDGLIALRKQCYEFNEKLNNNATPSSNIHSPRS